jgi:hypothetical protein
MPDWSIKFVPAKHPTPDVPADFELDGPGNPPGPFNVFMADNVSWDNTTTDVHLPAVYKPVAGSAPPTGSPRAIGGPLTQHKSSPYYSVGASAGQTVWFCCMNHPKEVAALKVIAPGTGTAPSV